MRVRGLIRSGVTHTITAEAEDAEAARKLLHDQVADGYELTQVQNAMPRGGRVIATGTVRNPAVSEIMAEGENYTRAFEALRAAVPADHLLLFVSVDAGPDTVEG